MKTGPVVNKQSGIVFAAVLAASAVSLVGCGGSGARAKGDAASGDAPHVASGGGPGQGGAVGTGGSASGGAPGAGGAGAGTGTDGGYDGPTLGVDGGGKIPIGSAQCSDGVDNDGDNRIDSLDPDCTGPLDNDESSFATGIPGDNIDACKQDCFFDGNSGAGDDGCDWQLKCDPLSANAKCPYSPSYAAQHTAECSTSASQSQKCIDFCRPMVPNGCDCFGCCLVPGAATAVRLATTCTAADLGDPIKCPPCTQVAQCANPCDHCELCVGKTTLPADCATHTCGEVTACTTTGDCPADTSCTYGCCLGY